MHAQWSLKIKTHLVELVARMKDDRGKHDVEEQLGIDQLLLVSVQRRQGTGSWMEDEKSACAMVRDAMM